MITVTPSIILDEHQLEWQFIRASGPGGQNVNKVNSAVQLRFDTAALAEAVREKLLTLAANRINSEGILIIEASVHRSQGLNRQDALARLIDLIRRAAHTPKKRRPTRPTRASKERRLAGKKQRGEIKRQRGKQAFD